MSDINFIIERLILKIGHNLSNTRTENLKVHGLTPSQSESLFFFNAHEGAKIYDLKEHLQISHQAARNLVERIKQKNLVYLVASEADARAKNVFLTPEGKKICGVLKEEGSNVGSRHLEGFTDAEKEQLLIFLEKIKSNIQ